MRNTLGNRVKEARRKARPKMTQTQLAARLQMLDWKISRDGVARIESGVRELTDPEIRKLVKVLGVTYDWLFGEEGDKKMR